jgi:hypothetical protein
MILPFSIDLGTKDSFLFVSGMGRSGTTWISDLINYQSKYRVVFEPFCPDNVSAAQGFKGLRYIRIDNVSPNLLHYANRVLSGRFRSPWTESQKTKGIFSQRLIKDIRTNLMLHWLKHNWSQMPIVLVFRNPFSVATSWLSLPNFKESNDFNILSQQQELLLDYPIIRQALNDIDINDSFEQIIWMWAVNQYIPIKLLAAEQNVYICFYEELLSEPKSYIPKLLHFTNVPYDAARIDAKFYVASRSNFLGRNFPSDKKALLTGWQSTITHSQINRGIAILAMLGLDKIYDKSGYPQVHELNDMRILLN